MNSEHLTDAKTAFLFLAAGVIGLPQKPNITANNIDNIFDEVFKDLVLLGAGKMILGTKNGGDIKDAIEEAEEILIEKNMRIKPISKCEPDEKGERFASLFITLFEEYLGEDINLAFKSRWERVFHERQ